MTITCKSAHGKYLSAQPDGSLLADREIAGPWETFSVERVEVPAADNPEEAIVAFKTAHGTYLRAGDAGEGFRVDQSPTLGPWEKWRVPLPFADLLVG